MFDFADDAPTPEETHIRLQRWAYLHQAVDRLPVKYRDVVQMRYFDELAYKEIAVRQQVPLGTIKAQLHHSRHLLQQLLADKIDRI